jgi:hypothetical protein
MFEEFVKPERIIGESKIIIDKRGKITFSVNAVKEFGINSENYVKLYFDIEKRIIGFKFLDNEIKGSLKISEVQKVTYIYSKTFLNFYKIEIDKNLHIPLEYNKKEKIYTAQLPKEETRKLNIKKFIKRNL